MNTAAFGMRSVRRRIGALPRVLARARERAGSAIRRVQPSSAALVRRGLSPDEDYSGARSRPVPAGARRPGRQLTGLWVALLAGYAGLDLGFQAHASGFTLAKAAGAATVGGCCYLAYALPGAYLGSKTGRTTALLSRSILGAPGSAAASGALIALAAARIALFSVILAHIYDALLGWRHVALTAAVIAVAAAAPNLPGFAGIAWLNRYVLAPVIIAWSIYLVVKGFDQIPAHTLTAAPLPVAAPSGAATGFAGAVSLAIGAAAWGNEPDTWRYAKPRRFAPALTYAVGLAIGLVLLAVGGWMLASLPSAAAAGLEDPDHAVVAFAAFGSAGLAAALLTALQFGALSGGHYQAVNGAQNLVGAVPRWRRWHSVLLIAIFGALLAWALSGSDGAPTTALLWTAIVLPSITLVMFVDQVVLPALGGVGRDTRKIPRRRSKRSARTASAVNWQALAAIVIAIGFGAYSLALLPGQHSAAAFARPGIAPLEAWFVAALLYTGFARLPALVASAGRRTAPLAPPRPPRAEEVHSTGITVPTAVPNNGPVTAKISPPRRKPLQIRPSPRDLLATLRKENAADGETNRFVAMVGDGLAPRAALTRFAAQQALVDTSNRRSYLYLAARLADSAAGAFFAELADTERHALDMLAGFTQALGQKVKAGGREPDEPMPGCQAYPAYVAWLALNAAPEDVVLCTAASLASWGSGFDGMAQALRAHPSYRLPDHACAFFDILATPSPRLEAQALAVVQEGLDQGRPPTLARSHARMLHVYELMFWNTLAEHADRV